MAQERSTGMGPGLPNLWTNHSFFFTLFPMQLSLNTWLINQTAATFVILDLQCELLKIPAPKDYCNTLSLSDQSWHMSRPKTISCVQQLDGNQKVNTQPLHTQAKQKLFDLANLDFSVSNDTAVSAGPSLLPFQEQSLNF